MKITFGNYILYFGAITLFLALVLIMLSSRITAEPEITDVTIDPEEAFRNKSVTINISGSDEQGEWFCNVSYREIGNGNLWNTLKNNIPYDTTDDKAFYSFVVPSVWLNTSYEFRCQLYNKTGNESQWYEDKENLQLIVKNLPPKVDSFETPGENVSRNSTVKLYANATDDHNEESELICDLGIKGPLDDSYKHISGKKNQTINNNWYFKYDGNQWILLFTPSSAFPIGSYSFEIAFMDLDKYNNRSNSEKLKTTIEILNKKPRAIIDDIIPNPALDTDIINFTGIGDDDGIIELYVWKSDLDGELYNDSILSFELDPGALSIGTHIISLKVMDNDGAWSDEDFKSLKIDGKPRAFIESIIPNPANEADNIHFVGTFHADRKIIRFVWWSNHDNEFYNSTDETPYCDYANLSNGTHIIYFKVQDIDGVWSDPASQTLIINGIPQAEIIVITPTNSTKGDTVRFFGSGMDDAMIVNFKWRSSRDGILSNSKTFSRSNLTNGTHIITFKVQDDHGVWSEEVQESIGVNGIPQAKIIVITPTNSTEGETVSFFGNRTDDSIFVNFEWISSRDGILSHNETFSRSNLTNGTHIITFKVQDDHGVWSEKAQESIGVNGIPQAEIIEINPKISTEGETVSFFGSGTDDGWLVNFKWRSSRDGILSNSKTFSRSNLTNGTHIITFKVKDEQGNWSKEATREIFVNVIPLPFIVPKGFENITIIGSFLPNVEINITGDEYPKKAPKGYVDIGIFLNITESNYTFDGSELIISIQYNSSSLPPNIIESTMKLYHWNETEKEWLLVPKSYADPESSTVNATLDHLSIFAIFGIAIPEDDDEGGFSFRSFGVGLFVGVLIIIGSIIALDQKIGIFKKLMGKSVIIHDKIEMPHEKPVFDKKKTVIKPRDQVTRIITPMDLALMVETKLIQSSRTDVGRARDHNEDSIYVIKQEFDTNEKRIEKSLLVVADGMGGHAKGEVASKIAVEAMADIVTPLLSNMNMDPQQILRNAISDAHNRIQQMMKEDPSSTGMGTTVVASIIAGNAAFLANVGDSRGYLIRKNEINQITKDHSLVQEMVDRGEITTMEAKNHPDKNVITNVVGAISELRIDTFTEKLEHGDVILLTSDGLVNELEDWEIRDIIVNNRDPGDACKELIWMANNRGGHDNISVIISRIEIRQE